jgi:hypothetical protein
VSLEQQISLTNIRQETNTNKCKFFFLHNNKTDSGAHPMGRLFWILSAIVKQMEREANTSFYILSKLKLAEFYSVSPYILMTPGFLL